MTSEHPDFTVAQDLMGSSLGGVFPCGQLRVNWRGGEVLSAAHGQIAAGYACTWDTQFDIASITKLFTTLALLRIGSQADLDLDGSVSGVLPEISAPRAIQPYEDPLHPGERIALSDCPDLIDPTQITWRQLLTHTSGLPPWRPLFRCIDRQAAVAMALGTFLSYPPGTQVRYSDLGLIWVGLALERLTGLPLDRVIHQQVIEPLGLTQTRFRPGAGDPVRPGSESEPDLLHGIAPTEVCRWRGRRIWGEVHDENAARLGGVAGHAGLFSTATDLARLGQCLLGDGSPLLSSTWRDQMIQVQAQQGDHRRGLGVALRSPDPEASSFPLSPQAFGHTGFTGTSLWIDPGHELVIVCLTNSVYYGREHDGILSFRVALHRAILEGISGGSRNPPTTSPDEPIRDPLAPPVELRLETDPAPDR